MATLKLFRDEIEPGYLPRVCMRCGAPAPIEKYKRFSWYPGWVNILFLAGLLPWAIVAMVLTKRMAIYAPLCNQHKNHWLVRSLIVLGGLGFLGLCFIATVYFMATANRNRGEFSDQLGGYACVGSLILLLVLLVIAVILQSTSIRPAEITDRSITLTGLAREFKQAVEDLDDAQPVVPREYKKRFRDRPKQPGREEYYDPEERSSRRPREEDA